MEIAKNTAESIKIRALIFHSSDTNEGRSILIARIDRMLIIQLS